MQLQPGTVVDRYRVEGIIGQGALAEVYKVRHQELGQPRALKVLRRSSEAILRRAMQEGRIQASLSHPNIVPVYDVIRLEGVPALVMEYVEGPSLELLLSRFHPSLAQTDALARSVLSAMIAAHRAGLIHRDLKPANILVSVEGLTAVARVTDFGLARVVSDSGETPPGPRLTWVGTMLGTPAYMSPEQFSDASSVDARADIFGLGAVLYEMLTGVIAFPGRDAMECFRAIASGSWRPVRELVPSAPERMVRAIEGALNPDLDQRIQSSEALMRIWTGEDVGRPVALESQPGTVWEEAHLELIRALAPRVSAPSGGAATAELPAFTPTPEHRAPPTLPAPPPPVPEIVAAVDSSQSESLTWRDAEKRKRNGALLVAAGLLMGLSGLWLATLERSPPPADAAAAAAPLPAPEDLTPAASPPDAQAEAAPAETAPAEPGLRGAAGRRTATGEAGARAPAAEASHEGAAPAAEAVAAAAAATEEVNVTVSGVNRAWLIADDGSRVAPGKVPAGHYTLSVFFDPTEPTQALDLEIAPGRVYHIRCEPGLRVCR